MRTRLLSGVLGLVAIACTAGCGSSTNPTAPTSPFAPPSTITSGEVSQLASAVATAGGPIQTGLLAVLFTFQGAGTQTADLTQPCPAGGTARAIGPITV